MISSNSNKPVLECSDWFVAFDLDFSIGLLGRYNAWLGAVKYLTPPAVISHWQLWKSHNVLCSLCRVLHNFTHFKTTLHNCSQFLQPFTTFEKYSPNYHFEQLFHYKLSHTWTKYVMNLAQSRTVVVNSLLPCPRHGPQAISLQKRLKVTLRIFKLYNVV